ncbi:MAG: hypothetical protein ACRETL_17755, partial [Gammaproteobacteria bacterium]
MNQEKSVVNVLADDGETLVVEGRDGLAQTFHLNTNRTLSLHIRQLQVSKHPGNQASLPGLGDDKRELVPVASFYVRGQATIEGGSISVIGSPANTSNILGIGFNPFDGDIDKKRQAWASESGTAAPYAQVTLGFVRHQQSVCASDDWFVECELAADVLRGLAGAVRSGRLQAMTIGLALERTYSDDWTRPKEHTNWFLRPNHHDNNCNNPEMAHGDVTRLCFDLAPLDRRPLLGARAESK